MQLIKWDELSRQIATATDWDEIKNMSDKVAAFKVWAQQTKQSTETQTKIAEYKLRLERKKGEWLSTNSLDEGGRPSKTSSQKEPVFTPKLSDLGVSKKESYNAQQIASIPDDDFESFIEEKKAKVNEAVSELTTTGAVRLAKTLKEKKVELDINISINERLQTEQELKDLAKHINTTYLKEQRIFLISLIKQ